MVWYFDDRPTLAEILRESKAALAALERAGTKPSPIRVIGTKIARTFWGEAWCRNLESYSDLANRLPRGRTYLRGGNILHLGVFPGAVSALVRGSHVYSIQVTIAELPKVRWAEITAACTGRIDSLVDLLQGKLSRPVMEIVTRKETGLFPSPREIAMSCSCPDSAGLCKHLAAVLYGIGARLDQEPSLLFTLRKVDAGALVAKVATDSLTSPMGGPAPASRLDLPAEDLSRLFGIHLEDQAPAALPAKSAPAASGAQARSKPRKPRTA